MTVIIDGTNGVATSGTNLTSTSLILNGSTSGAITIAANATAGTNTLTLPANTGVLLSNASTFSGTGPAFSAYLNTPDQSITSATWTKAALTTEVFDTNNNYDNTTNYRFTPTVAGYYQINGTLCLAGSSITNALVALYKNGSQYLRGYQVSLTSGNANGLIGTVSTVMYMNGSTDYVELWGYITATSPNFVSSLAYNSFSGALIRAA
jgi:hypothetical protein